MVLYVAFLDETDGEVEDCVVAGEGFGGVHVDGAAFGGFDAALGADSVGVEHRAGRESDAPAAGEFRGVGHA